LAERVLRKIYFSFYFVLKTFMKPTSPNSSPPPPCLPPKKKMRLGIVVTDSKKDNGIMLLYIV
jgi:hypothetical protein